MYELKASNLPTVPQQYSGTKPSCTLKCGSKSRIQDREAPSPTVRWASSSCGERPPVLLEEQEQGSSLCPPQGASHSTPTPARPQGKEGGVSRSASLQQEGTEESSAEFFKPAGGQPWTFQCNPRKALAITLRRSIARPLETQRPREDTWISAPT